MNTLTPPVDAIELSTFHTWMGGDGICRTVTKPNAEIDLPQAKENSIAVAGLFTGKKFPLFIDARSVRSMSREARKHFSTNGRDTRIICMAIMVRSPLSRVIGNFFMGLNKPQVPARLFDEEPDAIEWLKKFL